MFNKKYKLAIEALQKDVRALKELAFIKEFPDGNWSQDIATSGNRYVTYKKSFDSQRTFEVPAWISGVYVKDNAVYVEHVYKIDRYLITEWEVLFIETVSKIPVDAIKIPKR